MIISFRVAYTIGQAGAGRFLDAVGTRAGLTVTVAFYSAAAMLTSLATGLRSFCFFRFLLGAGEAGNWPGATKAVAEWFPRKESGWAVALFDSGSSIGAAVAPLLLVGLLHVFGTWRPVFLITGSLGVLWILLFRSSYYPPETHPRISAEEREYILADRDVRDVASAGAPSQSYASLLRLPQTWGIVIGKALTDPVWFFITDWFAIYLASRGFSLEHGLLAFWVPFVAADAGNFLGGGVSSYLIRRGTSVGAAQEDRDRRQRHRHEPADGQPALYRPDPADHLLRDRDLLVRVTVDDAAEPAGRYLQVGIGGDGRWAQWRRCRAGDDRGDLPDGDGRGSVFVCADPGRRQPRPAPCRDCRPGADPQQPGDRERNRPGDLSCHFPERRDQVGPTRSGTSRAVNTPTVSIRSTSRSRCCSSSVTSSLKSARCFS